MSLEKRAGRKEVFYFENPLSYIKQDITKEKNKPYSTKCYWEYQQYTIEFYISWQFESVTILTDLSPSPLKNGLHILLGTLIINGFTT